jgi:hypothetical protein
VPEEDSADSCVEEVIDGRGSRPTAATLAMVTNLDEDLENERKNA